MKLIVVLSALCAVALGDVPKLDGRIVGGEATTIEKFPYQVSVRVNDEHYCGGSIIDENTILTAAHCVFGMDHSRFSVRVGATRHPQGESISVSRVIMNQNYVSSKYDNDVTILKLASPLTFNSKIQPISLQSPGIEVPAGTTAFVSGWGATQEGGQNLPEILRMVGVSVISDTECKSKYGASKITSHMMCAQTLGKDSCQGDSGGPLVANGKLIGVVSWGIGCARPAYPGVYAKVSDLYDWINANK